MWKTVIAPTALVSVLWIAVSGVTTYYLSGVEEQQARNVATNRETVQAADKMLACLWQLQVVAAEGTHGTRSELSARLAAPEAGFQEAYARAGRSIASPDRRRLIEEIGARFAAYETELRRLPISDGGHTLQLARATADTCEELIDLKEQFTADSMAGWIRVRTRVNWIRLCFLVAGAALGLLLGFRISRGMHQTLSQISVTLKDASGDLNQQIGSVELHAGDLPALHQQVQEVAAHIRQVVGELQQARRDIVRAERLAAVGELAAGVAHELRNPLTSVKLLIQTEARKAFDRPLNAKNLEIVQHEIGRMETTIQGLLDFARPPQLHRVIHDVRDTLRRALNLARGRAERQRVEIVERLPDDPVEVDGDPALLDQVFLNLLLNGIESMPNGGELEVELNAAGATACRVLVSDTGAGIPAPVIDRIFEPFVTTKEHGVGLGLAVSRRVVQEHGGTLEAMNRPTGGATFAVCLPRARTASELPAEPEASAKRCLR